MSALEDYYSNLLNKSAIEKERLNDEIAELRKKQMSYSVWVKNLRNVFAQRNKKHISEVCKLKECQNRFSEKIKSLRNKLSERNSKIRGLRAINESLKRNDDSLVSRLRDNLRQSRQTILTLKRKIQNLTKMNQEKTKLISEMQQAPLQKYIEETLNKLRILQLAQKYLMGG